MIFLKAQVSLEGIAGIIAVLFLFAIVMVFLYQHNLLAKNLDDDYKAENQCKKISMALSDVYSYRNGSSWQQKVDANAFFGKNFLDINTRTGNAFCLHFADLNNPGTRLAEGNFLFENNRGKVRVKNA